VERINLRIESVAVRESVAVARIVALSARRIHSRPAARMTIEVTLRAVEGEPEVELRRRARDTALEFLDIA
jgi:hypothetical protein